MCVCTALLFPKNRICVFFPSNKTLSRLKVHFMSAEGIFFFPFFLLLLITSELNNSLHTCLEDQPFPTGSNVAVKTAKWDQTWSALILSFKISCSFHYIMLKNGPSLLSAGYKMRGPFFRNSDTHSETMVLLSDNLQKHR